ncbi:MAG: large repetitive protein [Verrucomicrobiota bacterium]|jgi:hypothetical protein
MAKKRTAIKKSATKKSIPKKATKKRSTPKKAVITKSVVPTSLRKKSTLTFLTESLPGFTVGRGTKTRIQAIGGTPPYSFGLSQASSLPAGLSLDYQGTLSGTPTQSGDTTIFVKVIDLIGGNVTQAFDLQVN